MCVVFGMQLPLVLDEKYKIYKVVILSYKIDSGYGLFSVLYFSPLSLQCSYIILTIRKFSDFFFLVNQVAHIKLLITHSPSQWVRVDLPPRLSGGGLEVNHAEE